ncbi:MAG: 3-oxoacyl-ACP synthase III family protein [Burkholderiales bacterium]
MASSAVILSTAAYLPPQKLTIEDFVRMGAQRTLVEKWGVFEHRVAEGETATDMEAKAGLLALERAGLKPEEVDLIIGTTTLAEKINPPNVMLTQYKIGASNAGVFQVDLSCGGAIPAMMVADSFIKSGMYSKILLVASCCVQRVMDPTDQASFAVMGDGASAVVIGTADENTGFLSANLQSGGGFWHYSGVETRSPKYPERTNDPSQKLYFYIDFEESKGCNAFNRYVVQSVPACASRLLEEQGLAIGDIDWVISHQNINPIFGSWFRQLRVPVYKTILTNAKYGNIGAANIWVNLDEGARLQKFKNGDLILMMGQGSGFAVGSMLMRWSSRANCGWFSSNRRQDSANADSIPVPL